MRKLLIGLLVVFLVTVPISAAPKDVYLGDVAVVSWLDRDTVMVVLANESPHGAAVTISTNIWDSRWRPVFTERTVTVPGRSIVQEAFVLNTSWKNEPLSIRVSQRNNAITVDVQMPTIFQPSAYVVRANEQIEVGVDLAFLLERQEQARLIVDDFAQVYGANSREPIKVKSVEGGFRYVSSRNSIEYVPPWMVLSTKTPQLNGTGVITFSLYKETDGYRGYRDEIPGPTILVYGRNLRFAESSKEPTLPRIITR